MRITRIISGGQTGADRAALDAAIDSGIEHGGWIPKGRLAEDGPLPEAYRLKETPTAGYPERTEQNVRDSDGTVIFSRGALTGGSKLTAELAQKHDKPHLHVDLNQIHPLKASGLAYRWILTEGVSVLNVAGPRASMAPDIYPHTYRAVWGIFALDAMDGAPLTDLTTFRFKVPARKTLIWPETLEELVDFLQDCLPFALRIQISRMNEKQLAEIHAGLGACIQNSFGLWQGNDRLLKSVESWTFRETASPADASWVVVRALATKIRHTHLLKVVQ